MQSAASRSIRIVCLSKRANSSWISWCRASLGFRSRKRCEGIEKGCGRLRGGVCPYDIKLHTVVIPDAPKARSGIQGPHVMYFVYLTASKRNGTLYLGVTRDLVRRAYEHKAKTTNGFTARHNISRLVWFEPHSDVEVAILREKEIKKWRRAWKLELIEKENPQWRDLYEEIAC